MGLPGRRKRLTAVWIQSTNVTDNRRTDTGRQQRPRLRIAWRGKNDLTQNLMQTMTCGLHWLLVQNSVKVESCTVFLFFCPAFIYLSVGLFVTTKHIAYSANCPSATSPISGSRAEQISSGTARHERVLSVDNHALNSRLGHNFSSSHSVSSVTTFH